jgi:hypothetical protein
MAATATTVVHANGSDEGRAVGPEAIECHKGSCPHRQHHRQQSGEVPPSLVVVEFRSELHGLGKLLAAPHGGKRRHQGARGKHGHDGAHRAAQRWPDQNQDHSCGNQGNEHHRGMHDHRM